MPPRFLYYLNRPEYIFRPSQIYRRILRSLNSKTNSEENILLPWGATLKIHPNIPEVIGRALLAIGIYDLIVTEVLWRLVDRGETVIDVGANIGYMASIMAKRVGETGKVWCFEPNPEVYAELSENVRNWQERLGWQQINTQQLALSNYLGEGILNVPLRNRGEASLVPQEIEETQNDEIFKAYTVSLTKLDNFFQENEQIGVLKIDVEGHELEVLQGAVGLIASHQIRDVVFEEHQGYPSPTSQFLEEHEYTVFRLWKGFWKPCLDSPTKQQVHPWEPPSYLATREPLRAIERLKKLGWSSLNTRTQ